MTNDVTHKRQGGTFGHQQRLKLIKSGFNATSRAGRGVRLQYLNKCYNNVLREGTGGEVANEMRGCSDGQQRLRNGMILQSKSGIALNV